MGGEKCLPCTLLGVKWGERQQKCAELRYYPFFAVTEIQRRNHLPNFRHENLHKTCDKEWRSVYISAEGCQQVKWLRKWLWATSRFIFTAYPSKLCAPSLLIAPYIAVRGLEMFIPVPNKIHVSLNKLEGKYESSSMVNGFVPVMNNGITR